ncbi:VOC family protein [Tomitella gaofuii]|uniref:VOC family protein n=1 Tax=Tomitella gaofuii TaxID=2760083 RepID=UPI0015FC8069|nr:VOC family protein [Tomitella gaofuii]
MSTATNSTAPIAADGPHTANGTPRGFTALTPFLVVPGAAAAIEFYVAAFGATEVSRVEVPAPDGAGTVVAHAELDFGDGRLQLGDPNPQYGLVADARPEGADADCVSHSMALYRPDVDAVVERAIARGATLREPVADFVSGDRFASLLDPFGQRWSVMTRTVDLSQEESARRVDEWAAAGFPALD